MLESLARLEVTETKVKSESTKCRCGKRIKGQGRSICRSCQRESSLLAEIASLKAKVNDLQYKLAGLQKHKHQPTGMDWDDE